MIPVSLFFTSRSSHTTELGEHLFLTAPRVGEYVVAPQGVFGRVRSVSHDVIEPGSPTVSVYLEPA